MAGNKTIEVDVVAAYKHMGSYGDVSKDIVFKCAAILPLLRRLERRIFVEVNITMAAKKNILQSLLMAKLGYQCGVWPLLNQSQYNRFAGCYTMACRAAVMMRNDHEKEIYFNDFEAMSVAGVPHPAAYLRVQRLHLFQRLIIKEHDSVVDTLIGSRKHKKSWHLRFFQI